MKRPTAPWGHSFVVTGGFDVDRALVPQLDAVGAIYGFRRPDGATVRLCVALEVENKDGGFTYVTDTDAMEKLGFANLDYAHLDFTPEGAL